jgi:serine/threonine protein kinase
MVRLQQELSGTYTIVDRIGSGGMGDVYLANHKALGGKWAIKVLADELARDPMIVERFIREAQIEANLQHPNIVKVFDISTRGDFQFLVMPFVEGENLDERLKRLKVLDPVEAVTIALHAARALECAHENSIIHRDLKPSNIRIDHYGTVIVMDFGIARVLDTQHGKTALGSRIGTPQYMSPEQSAGRPVDHRSDLYSLGVILYEMMSGENPFLSDNPFAIGVKHLTFTPPSLSAIRDDLKPGLSEIVEKLMAKEPADRFQNASELREALTPFGGGVEIRTPMPVTKTDTAGLTPASLLRLGPLDAILHRIPEPENTRALSAEEESIMNLIDDVRTVREVLEQVPVAETPAAAALESLQDDGFIYTEIPAFTDPGTMPPTILPASRSPLPPTQVPFQPSQPKFKTTSQPGGQVSQPGIPREPTPQPATAEPAAVASPAPAGMAARSKYIIAAIILIVLAGSGFLLYPTLFPPSPILIQFDASPFAKATVKSENDKVLFSDDTPFQKELRPGNYVVDFVCGSQTRSEKLTVGPGSPALFRVEFWNEGQTNKLVEGLK